MELCVVNQPIQEVPTDAVIVSLFEGVTVPTGATAAVDQALGGAIHQMIAAGDFRGRKNETAVLYTLGRLPARKVVLVGLGKAEDLDAERIRQAAAAGVRKAHETGAQTVATAVHGAGAGQVEARAAAQACAEGIVLGLYEYEGFKSRREEQRPPVSRVVLAETDAQRLAAVEDGAQRGRILAEATNFARTLANHPGNKLTPTDMAEAALEMAREFGLQCRVLERADMERLGMGALLGVAKGSHQPPKLIVLEYQGAPGDRDILALVGKGLTFDSGGIDLKPGEHMEEMKYDMAGGAAVLGAMRAIAQLRPAVNVIGLVPATENMPGGGAQKPGDVVQACNGKTIEIISTDAEGRLILADAVAYACNLGATRLVDVATLTGACIVALGHLATGLVSNNQPWAEEIQRAAAATGERVWQLPVWEEYKNQYKSDVADLKNTGGRAAGTIVGGMIIGEFVGDTPWVHLDIAGTAWEVSDVPYQPNKAATGVMVRTLAQLALNLAQGRAESGAAGRAPR